MAFLLYANCSFFSLAFCNKETVSLLYLLLCTEEIYPDQEEGILIAYYVESEKEWMYFMYAECPYGWNVLCKNKAYWKILSPPNID